MTAPRIDHLPKSMQRRPEIAAMVLRVYPGENPDHYRVPSVTSERIYDVMVAYGRYQCACQAGSYGNRCKHKIAVERYRQEHGIVDEDRAKTLTERAESREYDFNDVDAILRKLAP